MKDPSAAITDEIIMREIEPGSRVIDLGCGDGRLLSLLQFLSLLKSLSLCQISGQTKLFLKVFGAD